MTWMVHHLARCGSHAIINWMGRCLDDYVVHFNNVNHNLNPRNIEIYKNGKFIRRAREYFSDPKLYICSTENFDLKGYKKTFGQVDRTFFIIRDPWNWIASSLKTDGCLSALDEAYQSEAMKQFGYTKWFCKSMSRLEMYKQYLREILADTDFTGRNVEAIDYNKWLQFNSYRDAFDFGNSDIDTSKESPYCGGSSFSNGSPLERWKSMENEINDYIDKEMVELYERFKAE